MKLFTLITSIFVLVGCGHVNEQTAEPAAVAWIEIEPELHTYQEEQDEFQEAELSIVLEPGEEMELKFTMQEGRVLVYQWQTDENLGDLLMTEFHGHTERVGDEPGTLIFYKKHNSTSESGALKAPFAGDHGWYFNNLSDQDIVIDVKAAGWYDKISEIEIP